MSHQPIAYTYDADTHCPPCAVARLGQEPGHSWPRDDARDAEGNPVSAIFPWDEWHEVEDARGTYTLVCGTCNAVLDSCEHGEDESDPDPCTCEACDTLEDALTAEDLQYSDDEGALAPLD